MINKEEVHPATLAEESNPSINFKETLSKYVYHWPLFLLSLTLCLGAAFLYLRYAQPIYSVNSVLLIKDEKKGGMPAAGDLLNELDLFGSSKVVDNEIEILKSKTLMRKVVDRLSLSISLSAEGRIKKSDLYSSGMLNLDVYALDSTSYGKSFHFRILDENTYQLEEFTSGVIIKGRFNQPERNALGMYKITKGNNYKLLPKTSVSLTINNPSSIVDQILGQLNVSLASKQSTVLNLNIQSTVPERGQDILNTLVQTYNEAALIDKNKTTGSTIQFIDERLKLITGELTEVEKDVETFKSSRGLTDLTNDANLFLENVKTNDAKLNEVNLQISVIKDIEKYVNSSSAQEKLPSTLGISDPVLLGQITQLGELQLERDQLLATTTANNPVVEPITRQIETTRAGIKSSINNIYKTLLLSKKDLEINNSQFQGSIKKVPGQERQLISIKRQQTIKESLYLYLLQKKEEAALSYASAVADSRIVDLAFYSTVPVSPKARVIYLVGLLIGLVLPVVYLYGKDVLNDKVENLSNLSELTTAPIIGEIFFNPDAEPIVVQENSRKAIAEQFRSIRTNMQFLHGKVMPGYGKVTLFTSGMSGEGKTFVATNIAAALAVSGKKTVLLELDLRKPKVSKYLGITNQVGLSNYLIGRVEVDDIIQPSTINKNLYIVGSGPIPPNPSELLAQNEIEVLIDYLRKNFDEIVLDTPPIGLVTDAQILSRVADASFYLVRQNVTFKEQIRGFEQLYQQRKFPKLNVILNGVIVSGRYGYGYSYGSGYYSDDNSHEANDFKAIIKNLLKRF